MTGLPPPPPSRSLPGPDGNFMRPGPGERWLAGILAVMGCLVFAVAAGLDPYEAGRPRTHGTHRQLGLPACTLQSLAGLPCPGCGMTTSVSLFVHGDPAAAWRANWAGAFLAGAGLVVTAWLALLACGQPRWPRFSAENSLVGLVISTAVAVLVRYVAVAGVLLVHGRP